MANWWKAMQERFGAGPGGASRANTLRWLLIVAGAGAALMILNSFLVVDDVLPYESAPGAAADLSGSGGETPAFQPGAAKDNRFASYEAIYESELENILGRMVGVGAVGVLVTIESTEEIVTDRNVTESQQLTNEKDKDGATRHITQTTRSGQIVLYTESGDQSPIVRKTIKPAIRGVVIVAEGAENATIKKMILEAVERGLGVPAHRISIAPGKR